MTLFRVILVRIQSECGKLQTRITPNTDTFHAILACVSNGHLGIIYSYNYNLPEYSCSKHWADKLFVIFWEKVTSVNRKSLISVPDHESRLWENYFIRLAFFTKECLWRHVDAHIDESEQVAHIILVFLVLNLTHFMPFVSFYTPWKHQKTRVFQLI